MIAYAIDVEALGLTAVLGAFVAPVLLGRERPTRICSSCTRARMAAALGWVAARRQWRYTMAAIAVSFFGLGWAATSESRRPMGALAYAVLGGAGGRVGRAARALVGDALPRVLGRLVTARHRGRAARSTLAGVLRGAAARAAGLASRTPADGPLVPRRGALLLCHADPSGVGGPDVGPDGLQGARLARGARGRGCPTSRWATRARAPAFAFVGAAALAVATLERWTGLEATVVLLGLTLLVGRARPSASDGATAGGTRPGRWRLP